ncbi:MAG: hypothetical protein AB7I23_25395 [Vicinamibacterales bacterium]
MRIVLVAGFWLGGSSRAEVTPVLSAAGHTTLNSVPNDLSTLLPYRSV